MWGGVKAEKGGHVTRLNIEGAEKEMPKASIGGRVWRCPSRAITVLGSVVTGSGRISGRKRFLGDRYK